MKKIHQMCANFFSLDSKLCSVSLLPQRPVSDRIMFTGKGISSFAPFDVHRSPWFSC